MPKETGWRSVLLASATMASLALSGCGSLRLYSETRDKQGASAVEAWSAVDLAATFEAERSNLDALLAEELATTDRMAAAIRDQELGYFIGAPTLKQGLADLVDGRLRGLLGDLDVLDGYLRAEENHRRLVAQRSDDVDALKDFGLAYPSCEEISGGRTPRDFLDWQDKMVDALLKRARRRCASVEAYAHEGIGGRAATAYTQYAGDLAALRALEADAAELRIRYNQAEQTYAAATRGGGGTRSAEAVGDALRDLEAAVSALSQSQNAFDMQFISQERLEAVDGFIQTVTQSGDEVPADASRAELASILLPRLIDDARASLGDARKPLALPLLVRRNHEKLKWEAATREIQARKKRVALSEDILYAIQAQARQLASARAALDSPGVTALHGVPVLGAFSKAGTDEKEQLYLAAGHYFDVVNRHEAKRMRLEYMRVATFYDIGLAYSEASVKQWQSLIGATVEQVGSSAGGGMRAERVSELLNGLGLIWIGRGVNK